MSQTRFIILSQKRSGTHMLASCITESLGLDRLTEPFNLTKYDAPYDDHDLRVEEINIRLDRLGWGSQDPVVGFILHIDQNEVWSVLDEIDPSVKIIHLKRMNQLARYVSIQQVIKHQVWQCLNPNSLPENREITVDLEDFEKHLLCNEREQRDTYGFPNQTLRVTYEQLTQSLHQTAFNICVFLGVRYRHSGPKTHKTTYQPLSEIVTNYDDVVATHRDVAYDKMIINRQSVPCYKLLPTRAVGAGQHRSGWPAVMSALQTRSSKDGILVDDYVERTFGYAKQIGPHTEPWIGIIHHDLTIPDWVQEKHILSNIVHRDKWIESYDHCRALICLSEHNADQVRELLPDISVFAIKHPMFMGPEFDLVRFLNSDPKSLVQVGFYCRNPLAIHHIPNINGYDKKRLWNDETRWIRAHEKKARYHYANYRPYLGDVTQIKSLDNERYDELLSSSVIFMELLAASANNAILECIASGTPMIVNKLPSVTEYLGENYPLYYTDIQQIPNVLSDANVISAHQHLRDMDKSDLDIGQFMRQIDMIIKHVI